MTYKALRALARACLDDLGHPSARVRDLWLHACEEDVDYARVKRVFERLRRVGLIDAEGYPAPPLVDVLAYVLDGPDVFASEEALRQAKRLLHEIYTNLQSSGGWRATTYKS